ncbi:MAG TPA: metallophosphoesterase [Myxococcota bacterium]
MNRRFVSSTSLLSALLLIAAAGCASTPPPKEAEPAVAAAVAPAAEPEPDHPATWGDVVGFYGTECPPPTFTLDEPFTKTINGQTFVIEGTEAKRVEKQEGPLVIGVLGAIKDATPDTRKNLEKAKAAFKKAKVTLVLMNGDIAETGEITDVVGMIGDVFGDDLPLIVHSGNSEWTSGFSNAIADAEKTHPAFINMNFVRRLDLGGVHLLSLPGWSRRQFVKQGGCHFDSDDVAAVSATADGLHALGEVVILTAHGPPLGADAMGLDRTFDDGNVGDEDLKNLLERGSVRFGIFGHILEAGGRATADAVTHKPLPLPQKKPSSSLFVNVGSASSGGVELLNKKTSRGMAAIVTIDPAKGGKGSVVFVPLGK